MTPTADQSAALMAAKLRAREPFSYWRFGDGFLECVAGMNSRTCDGEAYSKPLAEALLKVWDGVVKSQAPATFLGDWQSASFIGDNDPSRYEDLWKAYFGSILPERFLHPEALLLMRESEALVEFYQAASEDGRRNGRRKLYFGARANANAALILGAEFFPVEMNDCQIFDAGIDRCDFDVLYFGAGLAGMIPVFRAWQRHPERTYIHLGSALDPLGRGRTRRQQLPKATIERMFGGML